MLAYARRVRALAQALAAQGEGQGRYADRLVAYLDGQQSAPCVEMRVVEQVPGLGDRRERQADGFELRAELAQRVLLGDVIDLRQKPATFLYAFCVAAQTLVLGQFRCAELAAEHFPLRIGHHADEQAPAVPRVADVVDAPGGSLDGHRRRR